MNVWSAVKLAFVACIFVALVSLPSCRKAGKVACELNVKVEQDDGTPVERANASVRYPVGIKVNPGGSFPTDRHETTKGATNADGEVVLRYETLSSPEGLLWIKKEGYYASIYEDFTWDKIGNSLRDRRADVEAVLKPVKNPIPMIFKPRSGFIIKEIGVEYKFDLELGELLPPHGKGIHPDLLVTMDGTRIDNGPNKDENIDFRASIRFSNPLDGLIEFPVQPKDEARGPSFISDYQAPESGYLPLIERRGMWGDVRKTPEYWDNEHGVEKKAYYFRVRTKTDEDGKIISSNYGKIYGPLKLVPGRMRNVGFESPIEAGFSIHDLYFNPTSNDRNVECDTKMNLFKKLDEYGQPYRVDRP